MKTLPRDVDVHEAGLAFDALTRDRVSVGQQVRDPPDAQDVEAVPPQIVDNRVPRHSCLPHCHDARDRVGPVVVLPLLHPVIDVVVAAAYGGPHDGLVLILGVRHAAASFSVCFSLFVSVFLFPLWCLPQEEISRSHFNKPASRTILWPFSASICSLSVCHMAGRRGRLFFRVIDILCWGFMSTRDRLMGDR